MTRLIRSEVDYYIDNPQAFNDDDFKPINDNNNDIDIDDWIEENEEEDQIYSFVKCTIKLNEQKVASKQKKKKPKKPQNQQ